MISQRDDAHVAKGLALLTEQFKGKPVIEALLSAPLGRVQRLEDEIWVALWGWVLDYAEGQQLDDLGVIVGQPREGRSDEDYKFAIRVRIRVNRSQGKAEDVIQVARLLSSVSTYVEYFPLGWEVSIYNILNSGDVIRLLTETKAASSYGVLLTSTWAEEDVFKWDYLVGTPVTTSTWDYTTAAEESQKWPAALPTNPAYRRALT